MRVLVISRAPWRNDNSIGSTFSDFFCDFSDAEIFSLCMRDEAPQNNIAKRNFYISEKQMIKGLFCRKKAIGQESLSGNDDNGYLSEKRVYDMVKKHPNTFLLLAREFLWNIGGWKNNNLKRYVEEVNPDIVFFPVFGCYYPHKILQYIHSTTDAKIVLFHADDNYTLKQFSISPLYWVYRFGLRKWVRRTVRIANLQYCISEVQKKDYDKAFGCECKVLTKFADFSDYPQLKTNYGKPLQLVFTGNININRWKSLAMLAKVLKRINCNEEKAQLRIYTATPLTKAMRKSLEIDGCSFLMGRVLSDKIPYIQREADLLVHAEGIDFKSRLLVRQSFSTKIVDYFKSARPIVAIGPKNIASIKHLIDYDCAVVSDNEQELYEKLMLLFDDVKQLNKYAINAYMCGNRNHNKKQQKAQFQESLYSLVKGRV